MQRLKCSTAPHEQGRDKIKELPRTGDFFLCFFLFFLSFSLGLALADLWLSLSGSKEQGLGA